MADAERSAEDEEPTSSSESIDPVGSVRTDVHVLSVGGADGSWRDLLSDHGRVARIRKGRRIWFWLAWIGWTCRHDLPAGDILWEEEVGIEAGDGSYRVRLSGDRGDPGRSCWPGCACGRTLVVHMASGWPDNSRSLESLQDLEEGRSSRHRQLRGCAPSCLTSIVRQRR